MPQHQPQALPPDPAALPIQLRMLGSRQWSVIPRALLPANRSPACLQVQAQYDETLHPVVLPIRPIGLHLIVVWVAVIARPDLMPTSQEQPGQQLALVVAPGRP